jgi:isocitrate dehydrogenase
MMKVSDPIIFGHAVQAFYKPLFDAHGDALNAVYSKPFIIRGFFLNF